MSIIRQGTRHQKPRGNMRTEVVMSFGVEGAIEAAAHINNRTRRLNKNGQEDRAYAKARSKITMPAEVTAWLNKQI